MRTKDLLIRYAWMPLLAAGFSACNPDEAKNVAFEVSTETMTVEAGDPVTFNFGGNPDYIVFYPGTRDCSYDNRERTRLPLDSIGMSYGVAQIYSEPKVYNNLDESLLSVYISKDFTGEQTPQAIAAATWTELSGKGENKLETPIPVGDKAVNVNIPHTAANLTEYLGDEFYIGFQYKAGPNMIAASTYAKPRIDINGLRLAKREPNKNIINMDDAVNEWAFSVVQVKTAKPDNPKYTIAKASLMFFPDAVTEKTRDVEVWMVSQKIVPTAVQPDRGMPIKGTNVRLDSYQYTYPQAGTYKATFIATNANMWESNAVIREVTVIVNEKP